MDIYKVLDALERIEVEASGLYKKLREDHKLNKEAAEFFYTMSVDEDAHAQIVRMERRIVQSSPKAFSEPQVNFSEINSLLEDIAALKATKLELPELIGRIYGIESSLGERYLIDAMKNTNDALHDFLLQLGDSCTAHFDKVAAFAEKLGVKVEEIQNRQLRKARVGYDGKVMINKATAVRCVDISEGGMFLLTGGTFHAGDSLSLQFDALQVPVTADAEVQFIVEGVGMGVMFKNLPDSDRELIARYVTKQVEEKGLEKQKRILLVGGARLADRDMRIYVTSLLGAGYKVVDVSGFDETMNFLRKGVELSCIVLSIETETDANYYLLQFISTLDRYKSLPVLAMTNNPKKEFRDMLIRKGVKKLLARPSTSPKRMAEEVDAVTAA
jgi:CheY-like chemotaxis protein